MRYQYFDCKVKDIIDESDIVKRYFIEFPPESPFTFKAGQFVMLDLPIESNVTNRAYSIASAPDGSRIFELLIVINPDGIGTPYIFDHFKTGSIIKCSNALGKFLLPEKIEDDICFICTGTGIAPLRSMTHHIFNANIGHKNIYMVFGNRFMKDILYMEEMEELARRHSSFTFIPVLSRDNAGWNGRNGYVHAVYEEIFYDRRPAHFYISGWSNMIKEARQRLALLGYERTRVKFELYD